MSERIEGILELLMFGGRQSCCGATNPHCARPPGLVVQTPTGCKRCGHPNGCHAW